MKIVKQYNLKTILFVLLLGAFAYGAVTCFIACTEVIEFTIPAGSMIASDTSILKYVCRIGLFHHLSGMPSSAKTYFAKYAIAFAVDFILATMICIRGIRLTTASSTSPRTK